MVSLLERRLIFVTGKGGTGKSTVARALGAVATARGQRVIVAELAGGGDGPGAGGHEEVRLGPELFTIRIDPQAAMEEYLRIKAGALGGALSSSRLFGALAMATPGLREMLAMGKIWELAQLERHTAAADRYDLVVVDAPATGHGVAALRTPRVFADTARVGPIAATAQRIAATIADHSFTAVVAVALAEEMPVRETLALADTLAADGLDLDAVVLNARYPERFSRDDLERIATAGLSGSSVRDDGSGTGGDAGTVPSAVDSALAAARSAQARADAQAEHAARLSHAFGGRLMTLPYLFCDHVGAPELATLATMLGRALA